MDGDVSIKQRKKKRLIAAALGILMVSAGLAGCSGGDGATEIRFTFSKREAIPYMQEVVRDYNASQDDVVVVMDTSGPDVISGGFVRGNPPDIMLANYNHEVSRFIERCALSDLSDLPESDRVREDIWPLMDAFGSCEGQVSALPYSVMMSGVIYNKEIFEEYGLEVPRTWDEMIEVADTLKANGVDPFYATFSSSEAWTIGQGWFDYSIISSLDVLDFFDRLYVQGTDVGPDSDVSFEKDFADPVEKMRYLADNYTNADARNRTYGDGNSAMAQGKGAMIMQGPWAFSEIAKSNPDLELGSFPLPMTDDPEDVKARLNTDLALMIPEDSQHKEEARDFLQYLYEPERILEYNESQLGFTPTVEAPVPTDPRIEGMVPFFNEGKFSEGPSNLVPRTIPVFNYTQDMILTANPTARLATMDEDWARLAKRR